MAGPAYFTGTMNIAKNEDWLMPFLYGTQNTSGTFTPTNLTNSTSDCRFARRKRITKRPWQ